MYNLIQPGLTHQDLIKTNKYRFERMYVATIQAESYVFLTVGLHFDHINKVARPMVNGAEWWSREEALQLLREAVIVMETKIIEDQKNKDNGAT